MDEGLASTIASAWIETTPADPDADAERLKARHRVLSRALASLLPDADDWTVLRRRRDAWEVVAVAGASLFRVPVSTAGGTAVSVERVPLDEGPPRVRVEERAYLDGGMEWRARAWQFSFGSAGSLEIETAERAGSQAEPGRDESFARALARATGWPA